MAMSFEMIPKEVPKVKTKYRKIVTKIPAEKSISILKKLRKYEPKSMTGQPLVVWDKAKGFQVYDKFGNIWIDFSSGVLVANAGHGADEIKKAIINQVKKGLLHNYCFPSELRAKLTEKIVSISPKGLNKVFLLTTGAETIENVIKLSRTYGVKKYGKKKIGIISFAGAFHGRTLGAQMIGGISHLKEWIINLDSDTYVIPFPHCYRCPWGKERYNSCDDECFKNYLKYFNEHSIYAERIAALITETFQGGGAIFFPKGVIKLLVDWCRKNKIIVVFDEVQAAFGRTGKMFGFEHYNIVPDLVCLGKGITSSLPLSAVLGKSEIMDIYNPNEMTSTHTGNPVCIAASIANIDIIIKKNLISHARVVGEVLRKELEKLKDKYNIIGTIEGKGLVYGIHIVKQGTREPDGALAHKIIAKSVEKGLLFFAPVGLKGGTVKVSPPLVISEHAIYDGIEALNEAIKEVDDQCTDFRSFV